MQTPHSDKTTNLMTVVTQQKEKKKKYRNKITELLDNNLCQGPFYQSEDGSGGGGFFLACEDFWGKVQRITPRLRFCLYIFLGENQLASTNSTLSAKDQSTVAKRAERTVDERSLTSCV